MMVDGVCDGDCACDELGTELKKTMLALMITMRCVRVVDIIDEMNPHFLVAKTLKDYETRDTNERSVAAIIQN
eukprot:6459792-Amphidinium_carterae.1